MSLMREEIYEQPEVLKSCIDFNLETIKALALKIRQKNIKSVSIAARGTSDHAAIFGKYIFEFILGYPTGLAAPSIVSVYGKHLALENMLVIGISQSGMAKDVLDYLNEGKRSGAVTVSITNNTESPLATAADYHLDCHAGKEKSVAATKTFTTQLMLLLTLAAVMSNDEEILSLCRSVPEIMSSSLNHTEQMVEAAAIKFKDMNDCVALSRGFSYPIALETALKIQETCYVKAKAYSVSDFYHGPIAIADETLNAILIAPNSAFKKDFLDIADRLSGVKSRLIIISSENEICRYGEAHILLPATNEIIAPFIEATSIQLFACHLSALKGNNPDAPRLLHKVTITV